ncbi:MAG TPA: ABC transporter ATP-binding protein, partial [Bacillota bacterium]|nr:ABC transporter ATP-binding protein [Bacillota bacterium]
MSFFTKYSKRYRKKFFVAVLFLTIEALSDLLQPTIMAEIIDVGVANKQMDVVWHMGGFMLLITAVGAVAASIRNVISTTVSQQFGAELRSDLFRKIHSLSFENMNQFDPASLVTRLTNDINQVQVFVNGMMRIFVKAPLLCMGSLVMAVRLNSHLTLVLAVVVPIVCLLIVLNMKYGFPFFTKVQDALDHVNRVIREYLSGIRVVKAFHRFDYEMDKFNFANKELQRRSTSAMRVMSIFSPGIVLTVNAGIVAVLWIGGVRVNNGQMQVGHIIAFINYMTQILYSLMLIAMVFNWFVRAKASAGRIGEVFAQENPMTWTNQPIETQGEKGRIDFEQVNFSYKGMNGDPILKGITFTCMPGEWIGMIGSTGSGKSTLVNLIPRFYDVTSGTIKIDGIDIRQQNPKYLRERMAIVPQKTMLFTGSVQENIRWGKENATFDEIQSVARMAEAHEFISSSPEGYESRIGQGGINFSGGQKQRLSIARALVRKP